MFFLIRNFAFFPKTNFISFGDIPVPGLLNTRSEEENRSRVTVVNDPLEACEDSHAVAVLTEWDEFQNLDWKSIYDNMLKPAFLFDGRRLLDRKTKEDIGFEFYAIGS